MVNRAIDVIANVLYKSSIQRYINYKSYFNLLRAVVLKYNFCFVIIFLNLEK